MHPSRPEVLYMQKHWDVMRTDNAGEMWYEISGHLPTDFGFPIDVDAHEPETIHVVPLKSDSEHFPPEGRLRVCRSKRGGHEGEALTKGLPQQDCYVNVLRDAMAVDALDPAAFISAPPGAGLWFHRQRRLMAVYRPRLARGLFRRGPDAAMTRVVLPFHLRTLARVEGDVEIGAESSADPARGA